MATIHLTTNQSCATRKGASSCAGATRATLAERGRREPCRGRAVAPGPSRAPRRAARHRHGRTSRGRCAAPGERDEAWGTPRPGQGRARQSGGQSEAGPRAETEVEGIARPRKADAPPRGEGGVARTAPWPQAALAGAGGRAVAASRAMAGLGGCAVAASHAMAGPGGARMWGVPRRAGWPCRGRRELVAPTTGGRARTGAAPARRRGRPPGERTGREEGTMEKERVGEGGERGWLGAVGEDKQRRGDRVGGTHPQAAAARTRALGFGEGAPAVGGPRWAAQARRGRWRGPRHEVAGGKGVWR
jgi:hypothetical protein